LELLKLEFLQSPEAKEPKGWDGKIMGGKMIDDEIILSEIILPLLRAELKRQIPSFARDFTYTVRKTHTSSARAARYHTLAGKHKRTIGLAKQNSFARRNRGPREMRAKLDARTLPHKIFRRLFCAAGSLGRRKTLALASISVGRCCDGPRLTDVGK